MSINVQNCTYNPGLSYNSIFITKLFDRSRLKETDVRIFCNTWAVNSHVKLSEKGTISFVQEK